MAKVRKVDLAPDEFLVGIMGMTLEEIGVYIVSILLMYSSGGPIDEHDDRLYGIIKARRPVVDKAVEKLIGKGKLRRENVGKMYQSRVERELKASCSRIEAAVENGRSGGRPKEKQPLTKPEAFFPEKLSPSPSPSPSLIIDKEKNRLVVGHQGSREWPEDERRAYAWKKVAEAIGDGGWEVVDAAANGNVNAKRRCKQIARSIQIRWYDGK